eukprot:4086745-Alexandrium_andersonii.AAC.1
MWVCRATIAWGRNGESVKRRFRYCTGMSESLYVGQPLIDHKRGTTTLWATLSNCQQLAATFINFQQFPTALSSVAR